MKILKNILIGLAILIVLLLAAAVIFVKTFDVNKYLPQITQQVGTSINRKVNIQHADLKLGLDGLALELKNLTVSDDPKISPNNFVEVQDVQVGVNVMDVVVKRQINVTRVTVDSPKVSIVQLADGSFNFSTMVPASSPSQTAAAAKTPAASGNAQPSQALALPSIFVKSISVTHVQLSFEDQNPQMPLKVVVPDASLTINDFSLNAPFDFNASLNVFGQNQNNININGRCSLDLATTTVHISDLTVKSDLGQLDLQKVKSASSLLDKLPTWPQEVKGQLLISLPQLDASAKGLQGLSLLVALTDGSVKLKELLSPVDHITLKAQTDLNNLTVSQIQANAGSGEIDAQGNVHGLTTMPTYDFQLQTKSVKVEELVDQSKAPAEVTGELNAQFSGSGQSFDPKDMMQNLKGQGQASLNNAKIEKLNILKTILGGLNGIPGIGGLLQNAIETKIPANIKSELDTDTTVLDKAEGTIKVENGVINLQSAEADSKLFSIQASGTIGFDMTTNVDVKTYVAADISAAITKSAQPLQGLYDDQNRLYIPGNVSGKIPNLGYRPQMDYVTKKVAVMEGSQELQKVFKKNPAVGNLLNAFLGGSNQSQGATDASGADQSTNNQGQGSASSKAINGLLNSFFK